MRAIAFDQEGIAIRFTGTSPGGMILAPVDGFELGFAARA
jgi:hypothetical protein